MERDDHQILMLGMELHFIDMRAFVDEQCDKNSTAFDAGADMFTKWLTLITQKEIADKEILRRMCEEEEVIKMAVETLARLSEDKIERQAYQRRLDELHSYNLLLARSARAEESERRAEESFSSMANFLQGKHYSVAEIAEAMNLSEQKIKEILNCHGERTDNACERNN